MPNWLAQRAHLSTERLALVVGNRRWSYAELDQSVTQIARMLRGHGIGAGDRVAVLLRNGYPFVGLVHALVRLGAILVPLNTRLTAAEIGWQIDDVGTRVLVYDAHQASLAAKVSDRRPELHQIRVAADATADEIEPASQAVDVDVGTDPWCDRIDLSAAQSVIYTSGTTGFPKGAMITYGNLWWSAVGSVLNLGHHHEDRWLACLPLFHVGGLSILFRSVIYGIAAIVHEAFDASAVNQAIDEDGVTIISVVSTMLQRMLEARGPRPYPSTLRCVLVGGGPVPPSLLETCARRHVPVVQTYGLTEAASQVATLAPEDALRKIGSAGKPLLPTELRIERDREAMPAGEIGEIVVRGPTISPGYVNYPEAATRALHDGWLRTGDLGYLDDEGFLYVVDRRDDLIISGGENVYPAEVEAVLREHPAVEEAGVVGVPDAEWGQVVAAVVKTRAGVVLIPDELIDFCRQRLARYKVPTRLRVVDRLPRNATGKLVRRALRELWTDQSSPTSP